MAMSNSYNNPSLRESLLDFITNLSPTENQLFTGLQKSSATNVTHSWLTDSYAAVTNTSTDKKVVEGADYGAGDVTNPTRKSNYTQIIRQDYKVSGTEQATLHAGMPNPKAYHMAKAMEDWKQKAEWAILHGVAAAGDASTARELGGIFDQVTTNKVANAATDFTEELFTTYLGDVWATGGDPDAVYVGRTLKTVISGFTAGSTKNVDAKDKRLVSAVDVYESDFGLVKLFLHRLIDSVVVSANTSNIAILSESTWALAFISGREPKNFDAPKGGDYEKGGIIGEFTLEGRYEQANFVGKGYTN